MKRSVILFLAVSMFAATAEAQYFGRNKVQYERFDFQVLATDHFDIYYYPEEEAAVRLAARMAERWYTRLSKILRHELSSRQPIILYAAHPHFQQTNAISGDIGEGTGGVTEMFKRRVVLPFAGGLAETDHVLGHELVHAFQYDISSRRDAAGRPIGPAVMRLPLWFIEGMAEYLSLGPIDANTAMWIRDAAARDSLPTVDRLDDPDFFPYRYGHAFWAYVAGRWGDEVIVDLLNATGSDGRIDLAIQGVLGVDVEQFSRDWHDATRRTYAPVFETTRPASSFGRALITAEMGGGEMNLAPAVSPDGQRVVFLSERSLFSIDMYVADVATGRITRRLVATAGDPHFDSLQFLSSAGDWAPDSRRFAFAALKRGQPVLTIVDTESGEREAEHEFPQLGEIFNPAWSPDGQQIAFSALAGGVLDLYLFDLRSSSLRQLTKDPYSDLDPEWSPDGRYLVWVTDRFSSNLDTLEFGPSRIGRLNIADGDMRPIAGFESGRSSNPEFAPDGRSLYFIAAPDGIPNVYRADLDSGETTRLTNVRSGISGITPATPALSVGASSPTLVYTAFEGDRYNLYATELSSIRPAPDANGNRNAAVLPPANRPTGDVARLLEAPTAGLPADQTYPVEDYRPRLSLDAVGQPTVGIGADRFGAYAAGGLSLLWSDMLGDHSLATTLQLTSRFQEIGGAVGYLNRTHRWNWGIIGEQSPYVTGAFGQRLATVDGTPALVEETLRVTQINRAVSGILHYPFSRAQRLEFAGGVRRVSFDREIETNIFSLITGGRIGRDREELPRPDPLNLGETSAALVYDTSIFGATSPILGQRYRFEYAQVGGSLLYGGVLADYRRYFMPVRPFTFAIRGLHYGRYGRDGEDERLSPLYVGYPGLVRGYEIESFDARDCLGVDETTCRSFDQLVGTRIGVINAELRFPLLGVFSGGRSYYGAFPVELAVFGDAGRAWTSRDARDLFGGGDRDWVRSVGAALRVNAFGFAVVEFDYVKPLDRPDRGWHWQFNLTPGF